MMNKKMFEKRIVNYPLIILSAMLLTGCANENAATIDAKQQELLYEAKQTEADTEKEIEVQKDVFTQEESVQSEEPWEIEFVDAWGEWHTAMIHPELAMHTYDWKCLTNLPGQTISYEGDTKYRMRRGVDVSYHQGEIDWEKVHEQGYEFVILRIAYRGYGDAGVLNVDKMFHRNIVEAQAAGLDVGVYIFSQAINEEEALEEAQIVIDNLKDYELQLPVVYDPELIRDDTARTDDVTGEQFTKNTIAFCDAIEEAGYQPMIYSNMIWETEIFDMERLQQYPIWYADYEQTPQTPYAFEFWQHTEKGQVEGIAGNVDLNVQFIPKE